MQASLVPLLVVVGCVGQASAVPSFSGLDASLEDASDRCQADVQNSTEAFLASRLQALVNGSVLSCTTSEAAFVDATAALWQSGYKSEMNIKPAVVLQPVGRFASCSASASVLASAAVLACTEFVIWLVFDSVHSDSLYCSIAA